MSEFKLWTLGLSIVWLVVWFFIMISIFSNLINTNPYMFAPPVWWAIYHVPYFLSVFGLIYGITGKLSFSFRVWVGGLLIIIPIFEILIPPLCVTAQGNILTTAEDYSCLAGNDTTIGWFWSFLTGWGNPILRILVYVISTIVMICLGILILTKAEIINVFRRMT